MKTTNTRHVMTLAHAFRREAAARYAAVMTFPQDNMSFADRDLLIFL